MSENSTEIGLDIYPNPTDGLLNISVRKMPGSISISIYNILGELLYSLPGNEIHRSNSNVHRTTYTVDLNDLANGFYLLQIHIDEHEFMEQLIFSK